jgi:serine phosphatase RsbU (regulator of sigma subunit)
MMVWYTDGWLENTSPTLEEFGKKRCQKILEEHKKLEPLEIIEKLREASWEFYEEMPREDDVTIVIGKIKENW